MQNDTLTSSNVYEFDIYLSNSDGVNKFELGSFQAGILINPAIINGGTLTPEIVAGSSELLPAQIPATVTFGSDCIQLSPQAEPGFGSGTIIPLSGPGLKIARIRITNSVNFAVFTPDPSFNFTVTPFQTIITAYNQTTGFTEDITNALNHTVSVVNPALNGLIDLHNVTGSGIEPFPVGLDGSQSGGINYTLFKDGFSLGSALAGTGLPISFGNQTQGTYTIKGHRIATYQFSDMNGSAIVTAPLPTVFAVSGRGSYCEGTAGVKVDLSGSEINVNYTLIKDGVDQVPAVAGTGSPISFPDQTAGIYTVKGTNASGTTAMTGSATITVTLLPASPGPITGTSVQCPGLAGEVYSISAVTNATGYTWSFPAGWLITSGQGTTSVTVTTGASGANGNVSVTANNSCGISSAQTLAVSVGSNSTAPTGIDIQNNNTCNGVAKRLTVTGGSLGTGATWQWYTGSCGGTLVGTGPEIIVDPPAGTVTTYYVLASGQCNVTTCVSGIVTVTPTVGLPATPVPAAITICQGDPTTLFTTSASNATSFNWTVSGTGNTITGTGTTGTVNWDPSFTGVSTITVSSNGCNGPSSSVSTTITLLPTPVATISGSTTICQNSSSPFITFTNPQPLPVTITYKISGGSNATIDVNASSSTTVSVPTNIPGVYNYQLVSVAYKSGTACSNPLTGVATVTINALPVVSLTSSDSDNIFCSGTSITFTASGGINYNFGIGAVSVQNGPSPTYTTSTLTNGQTVNVTVTNSSGCSTTSPGITNFVNPLPLIIITTPPSCSPDLTTYSLGVTVGSGIVTSSAGIVSNSGGNVWSINSVPTGTNIIVRVTDVNGCESLLSVSAPDCSCPVILAPVSGGNKSYCESQPIPAISATVSTGETVDWYDSPSAGLLLLSGSSSFTPSGAGTYYAEARNITSGCKSSTRAPVTLVMNPLPVAIISSSDADNIFCAGTSITFTANGGSNYDFRVNGASVQNGISNIYTTSTLTNGQVVSVIVSSSAGCTSVSSGISNTVNPLPVATLTSSDADNKFCLGTSITFTASGGTNYAFRVNGITIQNSSSPTYTSSSLTNGQVVDVVVTNASGCNTVSAPITNTVYDLPVPTLTSSDPDNIFCSGTPVTFTAGGGTNYNFRVAGVSVQNGVSNTFTSSSLTNGQVVDVIVTNTGGCTSVSSGITNQVNSNPTPVIISSDADNMFCAGTAVTFSAAGGINYNFRVGGISVQNGPSSSFSSNALTNGQVVDVIVTNSNSCSAVTSGITNIVNALPVATLTSSDPDNILCAGSSVTFTAGTGSNYMFTVGGVTVQNGISAAYSTSSLTNGQTVNVIVTNSNGCISTSPSITNFVNQLPLIIITTPPSCSPDLTTYSLAVTVGSGIVTSSSGIVTNTGGNVWSINSVPSGTNIIVRVTDINGCESLLSVTAPNCACPSILSPVSNGDKSYCQSGVIPALSVTVQSGETADWYSAATGGALLKSSSLNYTPAGSGIFYAEARNIITSCKSSTRTPVTLVMNPLPVAVISSSDADNIFCAGTSITFTASGGSNYDFRVNGTSVQNGISNLYTTSTLTNGQVVSVIVSSSAGCTSVSSGISNTVNPLPVATITSSDADNTFCKGTSITFTAPGGYSGYNFRVGGISVQNSASPTFTTSSLNNGEGVDVVITNANGCTATSAVINNTVYSVPVPVLTSSDPDNVFCQGTQITFTGTGGTIYNFRVAGASVQNGVSNTYTTSSLINGQVVDVIVTNSNGCSVVAQSITNTVNPNPVANAGTGGNECDLNFQLAALPSIGTGTWTKTTGAGTAVFSPNANTATALVTVSQYGTYTFTWTEISNNCTDSKAITVNFYQKPVANAGTGGNYCGLIASLNAVPSVGTGTWVKTSGPGSVTFSPNANTHNANATVTAYGNYTLTWTENNGSCSSSGTVNLNFLEVPPANAGPDGSECGLTHILSAVPGSGSGSWTKVSGPGNAVFSPDNTRPGASVSVDQYGDYVFAWTERNLVCESTDLTAVTFHGIPPVSAGKDSVICKGSTIKLGASGVGSFHWTPSDLLSNPDIAGPVASPVSPTHFVVTLTDQYGCTNLDTVFVDVWDPPFAYAGADTVLQYIFSTHLNAAEVKPHETGVWTLVAGSAKISDPAKPSTIVSGLYLGENIFLWTVTNGVCPASTDYITVKINDLIVPSLITPNGDQSNEYFVLQGIETLGRTELVIFDRRGVQVYKNSDYHNDWNGVDYNEKPLPDDTYFYVIKTENNRTLKGYIVIRR